MRNWLRSGVLVIAVLIGPPGATTSARAESDGPYVHGALRRADENVYFCQHLDVALYIASEFNALFAKGYSNETYVNSGFAAKIQYFNDSKQCALAPRIDHISIATILVAPPTQSVRRSVVESQMTFADGSFRNTFVLTGEAVPPCAGSCVKPP